jgi:transforming growth factor-beta-induced protein
MKLRYVHRRALAAVVVFGAVVAATSGIAEGSNAAAVDPGVPGGPFCASIPAQGEGSFAGMADDPVGTAASNNPYLTTLSSAVQAAGLIDTLNGEGPFTILAPSNEAFAAVPQSELDAILADNELLANTLTYHVVAGKSLSAAELVAAGTVVSVQGGELRFSADEDGALVVNGGEAMATCWDIPTANATVHVIDRVLLAGAREGRDCFVRC